MTATQQALQALHASKATTSPEQGRQVLAALENARLQVVKRVHRASIAQEIYGAFSDHVDNTLAIELAEDVAEKIQLLMGVASD